MLSKLSPILYMKNTNKMQIEHLHGILWDSSLKKKGNAFDIKTSSFHRNIDSTIGLWLTVYIVLLFFLFT